MIEAGLLYPDSWLHWLAPLAPRHFGLHSKGQLHFSRLFRTHPAFEYASTADLPQIEACVWARGDLQRITEQDDVPLRR